MISSLLLSLLAVFPNQAEGPSEDSFLVHDGERFVATDDPGQLAPPLPVPLSCRSERVPRFGQEHPGAPARLSSRAGLSIALLEHLVSEQVLRDEENLWLVGEPELPRRIEDERRSNRLPWLARQDGVLEREVRLTLPPPRAEDLALVLIPGPVGSSAPLRWRQIDGSGSPAAEGSAVLHPGTRSAVILPLTVACESIELELATEADLRLDQLFFARARAIPGTDIIPLATATREGETHVQLPPYQEEGQGEERTRTLLVQAPRSFAPLVRPRPASADRPGLVDVALESGVDFCHFEGPDEQLDIRPTMGPGAAWGDADGDGHNDLYLVQGSGRTGSAAAPNRLFRNRGDGGFEDVTSGSGAGETGAGMGAIFFDAEGDGDLDLYVANYGPDVLLVNDGNARFTDVSEAVGVGGDLWSAGVAAGDPDGDGDLDLYVTSYLRYDPTEIPPAAELGRYRREDPVEMLPFAFPGERNTYLRNGTVHGGERGELVFHDVTEELGLEDPVGRGMQPIFWDFDRDGDQDLYVANDVSFNVLFRNEGDGTFRDVSFATGMDDPRGGMGLAAADVDADGDEDVFLTNWELEANALYLNNLVAARSRRHHVATFRDVTVKAGFAPHAVGHTSWGAVFFDAELDGDLDLFVANGYTSPDYESTGICVGQPNHFFRGDGAGRFVEAFEAAGPDLSRELASRCAVGCDYDLDGDVDLVVTANNGPLQLLRNDLERSGRWLIVRLRDRGANPFAIGAEVELEAGERTWRRSLRAGTSYLGGNPPELHFGLGNVDELEALRVRWPDGGTSLHRVEGLDRLVILSRPE